VNFLTGFILIQILGSSSAIGQGVLHSIRNRNLKLSLAYHFSSKDLVAGHMSSAYFVSRAAEIAVIADLQQKTICNVMLYNIPLLLKYSVLTKLPAQTLVSNFCIHGYIFCPQLTWDHSSYTNP
jgi:hypothetical protein